MFDTTALAQALQFRRQENDLTIEALAEHLQAAPDDLRALEAGGDPHLTTAMKAISWLGRSPHDFVSEEQGVPAETTAQRAREVAAFLRSDRDLKPESADAIEAVLQAAYARFSAA